MKRTSYPISDELKKWKHFNISLNRQFVLKLQELQAKKFKKVHSDEEFYVDKYKTKSYDGEYIRMVLYTPTDLDADTDAPCLIYYHGGGFVLPAFSYHFRLVKAYAKKIGCKVLFVDYRLAPTYQFPTAVEDGYKAYEWLLRHGEELGIDTSRIVVGGDSAGGQISTVTCLMALERGKKIPCGQMLLYPAVSKGYHTESMELYTDTPMCNSKDVYTYEKYYIGDVNAGKWEYISPIDADNLKDMPKTYVETAEFDCLRDAAILYAKKLEEEGVDVELRNTKGTMHAYDIEANSSIVDESVEARCRFLSSCFGSFPKD